MNEKIVHQFNQRHQQAVEKKLDRIIQLLEETLDNKTKESEWIKELQILSKM